MKRNVFKIILSSFFIFSSCLFFTPLLVSCSEENVTSTVINNNGLFNSKNKLELIDFNKSAKYNLNHVLNTKQKILHFIELNKNIIFKSLVNEIIDCNVYIDQNSISNHQFSILNIDIILDNNQKIYLKIIDLAIITRPTNEQFMNYFFNKISEKKIFINDSFNKISSNDLINILNSYQNITQILNQCVEDINNDSSNAYLFNNIQLQNLNLSLATTNNYRQQVLTGKIESSSIIDSSSIKSNILVVQNSNLPTIDFLKQTFDINDHLKDLEFNRSIKINKNKLDNLNKLFLINNSRILFGLNYLPNIVSYKVEMINYYEIQNYIKLTVKFENEPEITCKLINFKKCEKITNDKYLKMLNDKIYQDIQFINTYKYTLQEITSKILLTFLNKNNIISKAIKLVNNIINNDNNNDYYILDITIDEITFFYTLDLGYIKLTLNIINQNIINIINQYVSNIKIFTKPIINNSINLNNPIKELQPQPIKNKMYSLINHPKNQIIVNNHDFNIETNFKNFKPVIFNNFDDIYNDLYSKYQKIINSNDIDVNAQKMFENDLFAWMNTINNYSYAEVHPLYLKSNSIISQRIYNKIENLKNITFNKTNNLLSFSFDLIGVNEIIDENNNVYCQLYIKNSYIIKDANIIPVLTNDLLKNNIFYSSWMINQINQLQSTILNYEISYQNNNLINTSIFESEIKNTLISWKANIETMKQNLNKTQTKTININILNYNRTFNYVYQNLEENCYTNSLIKFINFKNPNFCAILYSTYINSYYQLKSNS